MNTNTQARLTGDCVYVVELDPQVWSEEAFRADNPGYVKGKSFYYVGMTGLTPEERFENHKAGHKANKYARDYGFRLAPEHYSHLPRMSRDVALRTEKEIAAHLSAQGHAVWQK